MSAIVIIAIAIAIVVVVLIVAALVAVYVRRRGEQRQVVREQMASDATGHRQEADAHASKAQDLAPGAEALHNCQYTDEEHAARRELSPNDIAIIRTNE